jgi:hypothetical protein
MGLPQLPAERRPGADRRRAARPGRHPDTAAATCWRRRSSSPADQGHGQHGLHPQPRPPSIRVANSNGLGAPSLDNDPADADWTTELATGSEDSTMSFGKRELKPHPLAKRIKVSKQLLRTAALPSSRS